MTYFNVGFGWNLPPGVTDRMIDEAFGGDDEDSQDGCPNPGRHCKCQDCQDTMADLDFEQKEDR